MKLAYTTLGCPAWDLRTICEKAAEMEYDGVDFRGVRDDIDVTVTPAFTSGLAETKRMFADAGVAICGISSSLKVCDEQKHDDNLDEARRTIPIALELGCETIRVFGGGDAAAHGKEELAAIGREMMAEVLALDGAGDLKWAFETHDNWVSATDCKLLLDGVPDPAFGALWDVGHTARVGGETPAESLAALGGRVYSIHIKDAVREPDHAEAMADGWRYVAPGEGQLPLVEAVDLLKGAAYTGWAVFEHEKRWHQELEDPETMFPKYIAWMRSQL